MKYYKINKSWVNGYIILRQFVTGCPDTVNKHEMLLLILTIFYKLCVKYRYSKIMCDSKVYHAGSETDLIWHLKKTRPNKVKIIQVFLTCINKTGLSRYIIYLPITKFCQNSEPCGEV